MRCVVSMVIVPAALVSAALGFEASGFFGHGEVQAPQHLGQHVVGFELQAVGAQVYGHVAISQVVGGAQQVGGLAMFSAGLHHHHGLRRGLHQHQRTILGQQHITAAHHTAAGQEHSQSAAVVVFGVETALLAGVPIQRQNGRAFHQHGGQPASLRDELVDNDHGGFPDKFVWQREEGSLHNVCHKQVRTMAALKLIQIGNSVRAILPKEVLAQLRLEKGDTVLVTDAADGIKLTPNSPEFEVQMAAARSVMKKRCDALRDLAK